MSSSGTTTKRTNPTGIQPKTKLFIEPSVDFQRRLQVPHGEGSFDARDCVLDRRLAGIGGRLRQHTKQRLTLLRANQKAQTVHILDDGQLGFVLAHVIDSRGCPAQSSTQTYLPVAQQGQSICPVSGNVLSYVRCRACSKLGMLWSPARSLRRSTSSWS